MVKFYDEVRPGIDSINSNQNQTQASRLWKFPKKSNSMLYFTFDKHGQRCMSMYKLESSLNCFIYPIANYTQINSQA